MRREIGLELKGDSANKAWGVMDVLAVTDFPDIRQKTLIQSGGGGTLLIIPREGGYLARIYVEMETLAEGERARSTLAACAQRKAAASSAVQKTCLDAGWYGS